MSTIPTGLFNEQHITKIPNTNTIICRGTAEMIITYPNTLSSHVRGVAIYVPYLFRNTPTCNVSIYTSNIHNNASSGNTFLQWSIQKTIVGAKTQFMIFAANTETDHQVSYTYLCDYIIIGDVEQILK